MKIRIAILIALLAAYASPAALGQTILTTATVDLRTSAFVTGGTFQLDDPSPAAASGTQNWMGSASSTGTGTANASGSYTSQVTPGFFSLGGTATGALNGATADGNTNASAVLSVSFQVPVLSEGTLSLPATLFSSDGVNRAIGRASYFLFEDGNVIASAERFTTGTDGETVSLSTGKTYIFQASLQATNDPTGAATRNASASSTGISLGVSPIPEPGSIALLGLGGLLFLRRAPCRRVGGTTNSTNRAPQLLAALLLGLALPGSISAQSWTGGGPDNFWSTGANWSTGNAPGNGTGADLSFPSATQYDIELDADWSVSSLNFSSAGDDYTLNSSGGQTLTFNSISNFASSSRTATFNLDLIVGSAMQAGITANSGGALVFNGTINNSGKDIRVSSNSEKTFNGVIFGSGGIVSPGFHFAAYRAANTFTGDVVIGRGTTVLEGDAGGFLGTPSIVVRDEAFGDRGRLIVGAPFGSTAPSTSANPDRINDTASVTLNHGQLDFNASENAALTQERIGTLTLAGGASRIDLQSRFVGEGELITTSALQRTAGATAWISGRNVGQTGSDTTRLVFGAAPALAGAGGADGTSQLSIVAFLPVYQQGASFATYGATGIRPLDRNSEFAGSLAAAVAGDNVRLSANAALASNKSINSLLVDSGTSAVTIVDGTTLAVSSGAVLFGTGAAVSGGLIDFGSAEGIISSAAFGATPTIDSAISGSGGVTFTAFNYNSGNSSQFILGGDSTYTGRSHLSARVEITDGDALGASGAGNEVVIDYGGKLRLGGGITLEKNLLVQAVGNGFSSGVGSQGVVLENVSGDNVLVGDFILNQPAAAANLDLRAPRIAAATGSTLQITGAISRTDAASNSEIRFNAAAGSTITVEGGFTGLNRIFVNTSGSAGGTTILRGSTETLAGLSISNSRVILENDVTNAHASQVSVNFGGTLVGDVLLDRSGEFIMNSGGRIEPGALDAVGTLTIGSEGSEDNMILNGGAFTMQLGLTSDLVDVHGGLFLFGPNIGFDILDAGGATTGTYTLIDYTGILSGPFSNLVINSLPTGWSASLVDNQVNKSVDLQVSTVPEPGSVALLGLGGLLFLRRRRKGRPVLALTGCAMAVVLCPGGKAGAATWKNTAGGSQNWDTAGNWSGGVPNGVNAVAELKSPGAWPVTLDISRSGAITLGTLNVDLGSNSPLHISISTTTDFTFQQSSGSATLTTQQSLPRSLILTGRHIVLSSNLTINMLVSSGSAPSILPAAVNSKAPAPSSSWARERCTSTSRMRPTGRAT